MIETSRENIEKAYSTFGLPVGSSFAEVMSEYRYLAATFHPDRSFNANAVERNTEKLKELNAAKKLLDDHFNGPGAPHKNGKGCICQPPAPRTRANTEPPSVPKEHARSDVSDKEAQAAARTAARKNKDQATAVPEVKPEKQPRAPLDFEEELARADERMRWKATAGALVLFLSIWVFSEVSQSIIRPIREALQANMPYDPFHVKGDPDYGKS